MKALITGSTGMIGRHAVAACRDAGAHVVGLSRATSAGRLAPPPDYPFHECDILDRIAVESVFREVRPDVVIHLAAQAFNGTSWRCEDYTYQANVQGTLHVLQAARAACPDAKVLVACSSAEYGNVRPDDCPLREDRPLRPMSPYGVSKVAGECTAYQYFVNFGMKVYLPRLFIHVGAGHPPVTALQHFAMQLALIARGKRPPRLNVGRLDTARDFIDVRDGVRGLLALLERGQPGVPVNICTGQAVTIGDALKTLIRIANVQVEVVQDAALLRPSDEPLLLGDNSRLRALGWERRHTMEDTLATIYADWMDRAAR